MIPKEVRNVISHLDIHDHDLAEILKNYLETSDRYIRDLEQHVDDLVAGNHGVMEDD